MATTASKKRKTGRKISVKKNLTDFNSRLVTTSEEVIDGTVLTGEKYQKLFSKTIKKTEPLVEKQVDMVFDTLEALKTQYDFGTVRFKKLIGWKDLKKTTTQTIKTWRKTAEDKVEAIQSEINVKTKSITSPAKTVKATAKKVAKKVTPRKAPAKSVVLNSDLKVIDGIGPKMEGILKSGGIKSIEALAKSSIAKIEKTIEKSGSSFRAINPESWLIQAKKITK